MLPGTSPAARRMTVLGSVGMSLYYGGTNMID